MLSVAYIYVKMIIWGLVLPRKKKKSINWASHFLRIKHSSQPPCSERSRSLNIKGHCEEREGLYETFLLFILGSIFICWSTGDRLYVSLMSSQPPFYLQLMQARNVISGIRLEFHLNQIFIFLKDDLNFSILLFQCPRCYSSSIKYLGPFSKWKEGDTYVYIQKHFSPEDGSFLLQF